MKLDRRQLLATAMLACLIVAGCERKAEERGKAAGEVLEGSISDAMIATDAVRSEPPIAPRKAEAPDARGDKAKAKPAEGEEPAASPTPETSPAAEASPAPKPAPKPAASEPAA